jgi:hypothetical protein
MYNLTSTLLEMAMYILIGAYSVWSTAEAAPLGLTMFSAGALLTCFLGAVWSLYKMLVREPT